MQLTARIYLYSLLLSIDCSFRLTARNVRDRKGFGQTLGARTPSSNSWIVLRCLPLCNQRRRGDVGGGAMRLRRVTGLCVIVPVARENAHSCLCVIVDEPNVTNNRLLFGVSVRFPHPAWNVCVS